jgi:hypothetical protein
MHEICERDSLQDRNFVFVWLIPYFDSATQTEAESVNV